MKKRSKRRNIISAICILMLAFTVVACNSNNEVKKNNKKPRNLVTNTKKDKENEKEDLNEKDKKEENKVEKHKIKLYFSDEQAMYLNAEEIEVEKLTPEEVIKKLIAGPAEKGHYELFPKDTKVLDIKVDNKMAYVNFDKESVDKFPGGSTGETLLVESLVNTLTLNKELNIEKVKILVDGKEQVSLKGHLDISEPLEPNEKIIK